MVTYFKTKDSYYYKLYSNGQKKRITKEEYCIKNNILLLELVHLNKDLLKGLMFRKSLKKNHGMLFYHNSDKIRGFHMTNTYIPLDVLFVDKNFVIVEMFENSQPMTNYTRQSSRASRYMIEIPAGSCKKLNYEPGVKIYFELI